MAKWDVKPDPMPPADVAKLIKRLKNPPFGTETSDRNLMAQAAAALAAMTARAEAAEAQVADLTAKLDAMRDFIAEFAAFKFDACYRHPASSPEDEGDDVTDAEPVWSWQGDARAALKAGGA